MNAGRLAGVFGLRGELKLAPSRIGEDAIREGVVLRARMPDGSSREVRVRALRRHQGRPLVTFDGFDDATAAEALAGATLFVARDAVALGEGEYFDDDLAGCALVDEHGATLAHVRSVEHYPAQDVLVVVLPNERTAMVPLVGAFIVEIDVGAKRIRVALPPGLLDERGAEEA